MSPCGESSHCFVSLGILVQADRNIGCVCQLHKMGVFPADAHEDEQYSKREHSALVHVHNQCFVGAVKQWREVLIDRPLGRPRASVLIDSKSERFYFLIFNGRPLVGVSSSGMRLNLLTIYVTMCLMF